jgi:DNA-cytosine methyltransferase
MTVLSLFDGISAGRLALERAGIKVQKYYASEIDKYAIQVSQKNWPDIIQLGDVTKWESWTIPWGEIDLVTGGFPCQAWSLAGKQQGDKDPRGMLFWTMLDVMKKVMEHNPNAKLLIENVKMKKEFEQYITFHTEQALGKVEKHLINSALVSAQSRQRYYWTNIQGVEQPEDRGLVLADIVEDGNYGQIFMKQLARGYNKGFEKAVTKSPSLSSSSWEHNNKVSIDSNYFKGGNLKSYFEKHRRQLVFNSPIEIGKADLNGHDFLKRVYSTEGKSPTLTAVCGGNQERKIATSQTTWRKLTPIECERLQTFPDNYTEGVSNTQRYKMLGNSWTVEVIAHIFRGFS